MLGVGEHRPEPRLLGSNLLAGCFVNPRSCPTVAWSKPRREQPTRAERSRLARSSPLPASTWQPNALPLTLSLRARHVSGHLADSESRSMPVSRHASLRARLEGTPIADIRLRLLLLGVGRTPPSDMNEKIRFRMARDRRPLLTTFVDKVAVRDHVAERLGAAPLPRLYAVLDDAAALDPAALPQRCVLKPSHGSGVVIIVDDRAPVGIRLPPRDRLQTWQYLKIRIRLDDIDADRLRALVAGWLKADYSRVGGGWCYREVPRRLIVEELLDDGEQDGSPADHRFWCVNGEPVLISRDEGWGPSMRRVRLMPDWTPISPAGTKVVAPRPPASLGRMLDVARVLSAGVDFVRVDLYDLAGRVVFGEMTTYPGGGRATFDPPDVYERLFAEWRPETVVALRGRRGDEDADR
jgi:hypothetical protein